MLSFFLFFYRLDRKLHSINPFVSRSLGLLSHFFYRILCIYLGIDFPWQVTIGMNFKISHFVGIVVNENVIFGDNVHIRQNTTIGNNAMNNQAPKIGNNVEIGANVCIIGNIAIGNNVIIGAGSVVVKDVPDNAVVVGNPAKVHHFKV